MSANPEDISQKELVSLKINGKTYFGNLGDTILDVQNVITFRFLIYVSKRA